MANRQQNKLRGFNLFRGRRMKHLYKDLIKPESLCFDLGTSQGIHAQAWAAIGANVICATQDGVSRDKLEKRFAKQNNVTVLDHVPALSQLVARYGKPDFCHISEDLNTLDTLYEMSFPFKALSFPYATEDLKTTIDCVNVLERRGDYEFNWAYRGIDGLASLKWTSSAGMRTILHGFSADQRSGFIFAQLRKIEFSI